ncbi:putative N6-adenine-specific DNA methylase [Fibrobacter sp. UWR3]|uniref:THUMP domain-containing class I SAM-dependent RNA methyltransferase n=1 Tax=Fibrobacter sp. UWR3 TaxID=1896217 RepID=UPI000913C836|nr:RNA methyltransferase [Fibrobacter sp. UWR3]SHM95830.1 putative N6-adenine-specific DNA methylase [Fibrobacter sp. UWR3]
MDSVTASEKRLKRQVIGKPHRFLAIAPLGFEQTLAREIELCHPQVVGDGKVEFTAKITDAWKAVAYTRVANRILMHIADFKAENFRDLEKKAAEIPWELYLPAGPVTPDTVSIHVTCKHSRLYHSDAVAERLQKVIEGGSVPLAPADATSATPSAGTPRNAPQNLFVTLIDDRCTLWLDLAGEELYKRGHERFVNDAPLKETIAAGMILEVSALVAAPITLIDPMAGSGTFSLEAAYMASGLIPGKCRDFALKHQPAFKPATWSHIIKQECVILSGTPNGVESKNLIANILTSDISERAIGIIRHNVECSPLAQSLPAKNCTTGAPTTPAINITPQLRDFFTYTAKEIADACRAPSTSNEANINDSEPVIVLNPPYGKRLDFDAPKLYTKIGKKIAELARDLAPSGLHLTVAILAPKDDSRPGSKFTCTANLLRECPALDPAKNASAKIIATSHGGLSLNALFVKI